MDSQTSGGFRLVAIRLGEGFGNQPLFERGDAVGERAFAISGRKGRCTPTLQGSVRFPARGGFDNFAEFLGKIAETGDGFRNQRQATRSETTANGNAELISLPWQPQTAMTLTSCRFARSSRTLEVRRSGKGAAWTAVARSVALMRSSRE